MFDIKMLLGKQKRLQVVVSKTKFPEVTQEFYNGMTQGHLDINKSEMKVRERFDVLYVKMILKNGREDIKNILKTKENRKMEKNLVEIFCFFSISKSRYVTYSDKIYSIYSRLLVWYWIKFE